MTLDLDSPRHSVASLEGAYAAALALHRGGLEFLHAGLPSRAGPMTVEIGTGRLSVTPWLAAGPAAAAAGAEAGLLGRLHAATPPASLPDWRPLVDAGLPRRLAALAGQPWTRGPYGEEARSLVVDRLDAVAAWTDSYLELAASTDPGTWVVTHGEPGPHNQVVDAEGRLRLVDLESMKRAPRERDLAGLVPLSSAWLSAYGGPAPDPALLGMFDLEWRLDEISQYAQWFSGPHRDHPDDRTALGGLRDELTRPDRVLG